jgi:4-amino-4-deoxy-L-arabinose transferase-like glycosyltransferase
MSSLLEKLSGALLHKRYLTTLLLIVLPHLLFLFLFTTPPLFADSASYHALGESLAAGNGYQLKGVPHSDFMPGYPLFIALFYFVFGANPWVIRVAQVFLFAASVLLNVQTAKRLFSEKVAALVFVLLGFFPAFFMYPATLNAEIWVVFLISLFLFISLRKIPAEKRSFVLWSFASGASAALIALAKPEMFLWAPLSALWVLCHRKGLWLAVQSGLIAGVAFLLVLSPWMIRNYSVFDRFVPFSTAGGRTFWLSAHQPALTEYSAPEFQAAYARCEVTEDRPATDACLSKDAVRMIKEHPAYFVKSAVGRVIRTLAGSHTEYLIGYDAAFSEARSKGMWDVFVVKGSLLAINLLFVGLGILGLLVLCRSLCFLPLLYLVAAKLAIHGVFFGTPRYGLHLAPLFAICAAALLLYRWKTPTQINHT